jgi:hypothetical protein
MMLAKKNAENATLIKFTNQMFSSGPVDGKFEVLKFDLDLDCECSTIFRLG